MSVTQVAVPYAVCAACLLLARRSNTGPSATARWWVGLLPALLAVPVRVPGLLMARLMVFVGGWQHAARPLRSSRGAGDRADSSS